MTYKTLALLILRHTYYNHTQGNVSGRLVGRLRTGKPGINLG
jgi:hypothetical protein